MAGKAMYVDSAKVITENIRGRSFSIGEVTEVDGDALNIHWYDTYNNNPLEGNWVKSWVDMNDNKVRHTNRKTGAPYNNAKTAHRVFIKDVIGNPFRLVKKKLPAFIVTALGRNGSFPSRNRSQKDIDNEDKDDNEHPAIHPQSDVDDDGEGDKKQEQTQENEHEHERENDKGDQQQQPLPLRNRDPTIPPHQPREREVTVAAKPSSSSSSSSSSASTATTERKQSQTAVSDTGNIKGRLSKGPPQVNSGTIASTAVNRSESQRDLRATEQRGAQQQQKKVAVKRNAYTCTCFTDDGNVCGEPATTSSGYCNTHTPCPRKTHKSSIPQAPPSPSSGDQEEKHEPMVEDSHNTDYL